MLKNSIFRDLARRVYVSEICRPFLASFEHTQLVSDVWEEWSADLCLYTDPMQQIALVTVGGKPAGYIGFDSLVDREILAECMDPITAEMVLSANTSLFDLIQLYHRESRLVYLVLRTNRLVGWLSPYELFGAPLRVCLHAMLMDLERALLEIVLQTPHESLLRLAPERRDDARRMFERRGYSLRRKETPYESDLLECTSLLDKLKMVRKSHGILETIPALGDWSLCATAGRVRNEIAHTAQRDRLQEVLSRKSLWPFVQWLEMLREQMDDLRSARQDLSRN